MHQKVQGSQVIKQDGFSDWQHHGVTIYGLEGVRRLESENAVRLLLPAQLSLLNLQ